ncbi:MAG: cyclopropane-fatty-acyl-phospholipid synthase family protein, partial [Steroidobacteraceae bacterium]
MRPTLLPAPADAGHPTDSLSPLARLARAALHARLDRLSRGRLRLVDGADERVFGRGGADRSLEATLRVRSPEFYTEVAFGGTLGAGEAYINDLWRCDDLTALVRLMVANREVMNQLDAGWSRLATPLLKAAHWLNRNTRRGSRRNIAAHYDLGNRFFELFLDPTLAYSCGIFVREDTTLEQASIAKFDAICRKLELRPGQHLLEIGTGWGGFAIHAAQRYGCRVTTTTLSAEQFDLTRERIGRAGLADRITLLREDYRDLRGRFDALASIEMIEAVGHQYLDTYFRRCSALLEPHGAMLLQAITIADQYYRQARREVDYIKRFIFPGGYIPSVQVMVDSVARVTDMKLFHLEDIGPHYARTLRLWRERFLARLPEVRAQGYPESFIRQWEYYLCYCEGG